MVTSDRIIMLEQQRSTGAGSAQIVLYQDYAQHLGSGLVAAECNFAGVCKSLNAFKCNHGESPQVSITVLYTQAGYQTLQSIYAFGDNYSHSRGLCLTVSDVHSTK